MNIQQITEEKIFKSFNKNKIKWKFITDYAHGFYERIKRLVKKHLDN